MANKIEAQGNEARLESIIRSFRWEQLSLGCGQLGLVLMAVGLAASKAAQNIGVFLMLVGILLSGRRAWGRIGRDPLLWIYISWVGFILLSAWIFSALAPEYAADHWDKARQMLRLGYILLAAWWFAGDPQRIRIALFLMLAGVVFAIAANADWAGLISVLIEGAVPYSWGFGMNEQHFGLMCILALLTVGFFFKEWVGKGSNIWRLSRVVLLAALVVIFLAALLITKARTVWIAFFILLVLAAMLGVAFWLKRSQKNEKSGIILLAAVAFIAVFVYAQRDAIEQRLLPELRVVAEYLGTGGAVSYESSMSIRFHLWDIAKEGIFARPFFGWGPAGEKRLISEAETKPAAIREFGHVHNSFLGLAVRGGVVGVVIFSAVILLIGRSVVSARRRGCLDDRLALYLIIVFGVFMFVNLTESYLDRQIGWIVAAFFGGASYSFSLHRPEEGESGSSLREG